MHLDLVLKEDSLTLNPTPAQRIPSEVLRNFCEEVFLHYKIPPADARLASEVLAMSDLRGIDSHGVARLHTYVGMLEKGRINPNPNIKVVRETPSTATVDGDNGLGLVVGPWANNLAMEKAENVGSGWVSVMHTNHYGIAGYYPIQALKRDLIGWSMTTSTKLVAPLWGAEPMLGTNPIAIAFPANEEEDVIIDMATSAVPFGKIEIAKRKNEQVPDGWIVNDQGLPANDPMDMMEGGALLPLGSDREHGGHKGYALSAMVDMLSAVLSGANWGPFAPPFALGQQIPDRQVGLGIGHFFGAMQIAGFIDPDEFKNRVDEWIRIFRNTKAAPGTNGPLIPGDPERDAEQDRSINGVPVLQPVINDLMKISKDTGIPFKV